MPRRCRLTQCALRGLVPDTMEMQAVMANIVMPTFMCRVSARKIVVSSSAAPRPESQRADGWQQLAHAG